MIYKSAEMSIHTKVHLDIYFIFPAPNVTPSRGAMAKMSGPKMFWKVSGIVTYSGWVACPRHDPESLMIHVHDANTCNKPRLFDKSFLQNYKNMTFECRISTSLAIFGAYLKHIMALNTQFW